MVVFKSTSFWQCTVIFVVLFLANACWARPKQPTLERSTCGYDSCAKTDENLINVHLVAHTHDDVGWLKTVDQYYYGSRGNIQKAGVQYILDSVVDSLLRDPKKKFIYVESAFFFKWWREQTEEMQDQVKMLVSQGRLEFIGGAWSMNDEATTHYQSTIDQFTWGLRRLNDTFGECGRPKIGWQIDPFGHSREMASLFAQMSFDGYFFGRMHYQDKSRRLEKKEMEMVWKASDNLGEAAEIFTGALYNTYSPPPGFCWDILCSDEPFIDNKHSKEYNVDILLLRFIKYLDEQVKYFRTNNIILTMGGDFTYQDANVYYKNLDKLIRYGNALQSNGSRYNFIYSTPSCYLKSLREANISWPTYDQDFFPYASDPTAVWTGYFTSRPTVKRYERMGNHFLQVCKQLTSLAFLKHFAKQIDPFGGKSLNAHLTFLREQMGVMQHHDAVTGTEKQHVANDYMRHVFIALKACNYNTKIILNEMTKPSDEQTFEPRVSKRAKFLANEPHEHLDRSPTPQFEFASCHLLNISRCSVSEENDRFLVTVYNPLAHSTFQPVRFPVAHANYQVRDYRKVPVQIQLVPITERAKSIPSHQKAVGNFEIVFLAQEIPPLGYKTYYVDAVKQEAEKEDLVYEQKEQDFYVVLLQNDAEQRSGSEWKSVGENDEDLTIGDGHLKATFDRDSGLLSSITVDGVETKLSQEFFFYNAAQGDNRRPEGRASGAYILRPNGTEIPIPTSEKVELKIVRGDVVDEAYQKFNDWVTQVIRIYHDNSSASGIEFSWTVGPIPVEDTIGKEVVSRFFSPEISNEGVFYTDSNAREMLKRSRNMVPLWRQETVAINYYPMNSKIYIEDSKARMAILTDRAQGASSLHDGSIDVLVHRRLLNDDAFGVGEALNETQYGDGLVATGSLHLLLSSLAKEATPSAAAKERFLQNRLILPNWFFFSTVNDTYEEWQSKYRNIASTLALALPQNVYLMTMEPWRDNSYLVRFEHILEKDEDANYSKPVTFSLIDVFGTLFDIESVRETNLAANQWISDVQRFKFRKEESDSAEAVKDAKLNEILPERAELDLGDDESYSITLTPMQIRTFVITVNEQV